MLNVLLRKYKHTMPRYYMCNCSHSHKTWATDIATRPAGNRRLLQPRLLQQECALRDRKEICRPTIITCKEICRPTIITCVRRALRQRGAVPARWATSPSLCAKFYKYSSVLVNDYCPHMAINAYKYVYRIAT